ncbi:MAG: sensor histidine kinase, partial [Anaerolineae bacterium]|nr:sensor histidine kinase [Anaerolineae bacterium]
YSGHLGLREVGIGFVGQLIFLLVPVILTAWQYRFRHVVLYSLMLASLQVVVIATLPTLQQVEPFLFAIVFVANVAMYLFVGYIVSNLMAAQRVQRRKLAEANRRLVDYALTMEQLSASRERNRLARELHDTLAHTLSGLAVQLDALSSLWRPELPRAQQILDHALATARDGLDETRRVLQDLRAAPLQDLGLALAIRQLAEGTAARASLELEIDVASHLNGVSPEDEQGFYRVAQEALANVVEHAGAQRVAVSLTRQDGQLVLQVADDGRGLAPDDAAAQQGLGLQGMRERAELMGGTLEVEGRPGGGTVITLRKGRQP